VGEEATPEGPARRRTSWSLKTIVEDVAGRPFGELQDPERPVHPYWKSKVTSLPAPAPAPRNARGRALDTRETYDPVGHLYPPLVGATGRSFHGPENEHHGETLDRHRTEEGTPGEPAHSPGPTRRPERLYLHYLLLHLDRLSNSALRYLRNAVDEEIAHRANPPPEANAVTAGEATDAVVSEREPAPVAPPPL
jgi:hypothetical protein